LESLAAPVEDPEVDYFTKASRTAGSDSWWERVQNPPASDDS
jgi:hypothetical protein